MNQRVTGAPLASAAAAPEIVEAAAQAAQYVVREDMRINGPGFDDDGKLVIDGVLLSEAAARRVIRRLEWCRREDEIPGRPLTRDYPGMERLRMRLHAAGGE